MMLYDRYRPKSWSEIIGQGPTVKALQRIAASPEGFAGKSLWISGPSGSGKTSIARLVAKEAAGEWGYTEIDAQKVTLDWLRTIADRCRMRPLGDRSLQVQLVNEAHNLRGPCVSELQTILETKSIQRNSCWIWTTTTEGQTLFGESKFDALPFLSRCLQFKLESARYLEKFAARVKEIAVAEGLDGAPLGEYVDLMKRVRGNFRAALCEVESGRMFRE